MKKLIIFLLFSIGMQAQITKPTDSVFKIIKCKVEIDGHVSKDRFFFKADLLGVEIYDTNKNKYHVRKCDVKDCDIIHLEPKNNGILYMPKQDWQGTTLEYIATPNVITK